MACLFHRWTGCKCDKCDKIRDVMHEWNGCKCTKCGKVRDEQHDWNLCKGKCNLCEATQAEQHYWNGCKCSRCGSIRDNEHKYVELSGACRKQCEICGKKKESHQFLIDNKDKENGSYCYTETCVDCKKQRMKQHSWETWPIFAELNMTSEESMERPPRVIGHYQKCKRCGITLGKR